METKGDAEEGVTRGIVEEKPESSSQGSSVGLPQQEEPEEYTRKIHGIRWFLVCSSIYIGALLYGLDSTIAADVQASIVEQFNDVARLTWVGTAYPLGSVCSVLPLAALFNKFDLKILFIASIVVFEVGSVLCGAAPNMDALIVGRAIAGIGGSGIFLGNLNFFSNCTATNERGRYISGLGVVWGVGAVLGPVVGGLFSTSAATWRWAFYINLVVAAICAPAYIWCLPSVKPPGASNTTVFARLATLDWAGFLGGTGTTVCFCMALTFAGSVWAWNDNRTIVTFVISGVLFILTFLQQYFVLFTTREARMFPPAHLLKDKSLILLNIGIGAGSANIVVPVYYIPIYFVFVHGDSALMAAIRLLPYILFLALTNLASGALLPRINYYWIIYFIGGLLIIIGGATMFTVNTDTPKANVYGYSILLGTGCGFLINAGYTIGGIKVMVRTGSGLDMQNAVSMLNLSQLSGQMLALLVGGQIFQSVATKNLTGVLHGLGFSPADISGAIAGTQSSLFAHLSPEVKERAIAAITSAISRVYIICILTGAATMICGLLMDKERLFGSAPAVPITEDAA